jgi:hypothetical protein
MNIVLKESLVIQIIAGLISLYDLTTLSIQAVLITAIFAIALYYITSSFYVLICVLIAPQVIRILNFLMGKTETFTNATPAQVEKTIQDIQKKQKESFVSAVEVSDRIIQLKNAHPMKKIEGPADNDSSILEGSSEIPSFMTQYETLGVPVNINGRIPTQTEESIPPIGTLERDPQDNPFHTSIDTESIEMTMKRTLADKPVSSNIPAINLS